jgi:hypothetical protein
LAPAEQGFNIGTPSSIAACVTIRHARESGHPAI